MLPRLHALTWLTAGLGVAAAALVLGPIARLAAITGFGVVALTPS